MKVAVIGTGYVGLTTGVALAQIGHDVVCIDVDERKIASLRQGKAPFFEPFLADALDANRSRLYYTTSIKEGLVHGDVAFLAVGTPQNPNGSANLTYLHQAFASALSVLEKKASSTLLVNKCTAPVGTTESLSQEIAARGLSDQINLASNPEFLRQGCALSDNLYPNRLVLGGNAPAHETLLRLYAPIINQTFHLPAHLPRPQGLQQVPAFLVNTRTAELAKYAANAFLAMKISFINEVANMADLVEADVIQVADIIGADVRIGRAFLNAGIGYGGSCFPKDTLALRHMADTHGYHFKLLSAVIEVNNAQCIRVVEKLRDALGELRGKTIAVLGLTFKPGTDDLREAPSIPMIYHLLLEGANIRAHDPVAGDQARFVLPHKVKLCAEVQDTLEGADAVFIVTEWPLYQKLTPEVLKEKMRGNVVVDGRNCLDPRLFAGQMRYIGVGRGLKPEPEVPLSAQMVV
ncbi:UDP-glucose dehydrogenase family protein [Candidatus Formimonas warabiya]|uniref:UDP-glucose 6-dehydrogenase n=1 Tax=Formimonas warabiya TaxID=1761012 RepID=A0A3G1KSE5_FORW1|nr:UDP-glucose/GDP-mannose dehydrogenase family protein [Candidatus Formimonas warabiya]ATW25378.1 hypothetical protein DCMF_11900 [Candidatus Formimonas warabiya]